MQDRDSLDTDSRYTNSAPLSSFNIPCSGWIYGVFFMTLLTFYSLWPLYVTLADEANAWMDTETVRDRLQIRARAGLDALYFYLFFYWCPFSKQIWKSINR